jgi:predicted HTH domain antitoxin
VDLAGGGGGDTEAGKGGEEVKKEQMVGTRIPEGLVRDLETIEQAEQSDRSTTLRRLLSKAIGDWKMDHYARLYGDGKISLARAAEQASVSLWEMMEYAKSRKIPAQYDLEDFQDDLRRIYSGRK